MKNKQQQTSNEQRAPDSIMKNAQNYFNLNSTNGVSNGLNPSREQRFFRVPFVKSSSLVSDKGYWWSHFDGNYIARQMEIHPNKAPILLVAGVNDMSMCELSLDETRLTSKRNAEILQEEFELEWKKNGGKPWTYK